MKKLILAMIVSMFTLTAFSQSKLLKGANATKTSETKEISKPTSTKGNNTGKKVSVRRETTKVDSDAKYASSGYMEITGISLANDDYNTNIIDDYDSRFYAGELRYLKPKIFYKGLASVDKDITLYIKIIKEDGNLVSGKTSPDGYSYTSDATIIPGSGNSLTITGYGSSSATSYSAGAYKLEIWYDKNKLYEKGFRVYSGKRPIVSNNILKITDIKFGSEDDDSNLNINFGDDLYVGEVKYLTSKITYNSSISNEQKVTLYYRIFSPDGTIKKGNSSPIGYTNKGEYTIKQGVNNTLKLYGWGNNKGTYYKEGTYTYEIWLDGDKIYEATFEVKKESTFLTVDSKTEVSSTFSNSGGTETYYVKTDAGTWETVGVPTWCEITDKNAESFTLRCKSNSGTTRNDLMFVKAGNKIVKINIKQY